MLTCLDVKRCVFVHKGVLFHHDSNFLCYFMFFQPNEKNKGTTMKVKVHPVCVCVFVCASSLA